MDTLTIGTQDPPKPAQALQSSPPVGTPPSFGDAKPKKSDTTWIWIVAGVGCVGMVGFGIVVAGIGAVVAYQAAEEAEAYEALYGAGAYDDPYAYGGVGYGNTYDDPLAEPAVDPFADPNAFGGLGAAGYGAEPEPVEPIRYVPVEGSPAEGPSDALVTVVVFADYQCPFCSRVEPTLDQLQDNYGADLRIVYKNNPLPFHQDAMPAAELALEARAQRGDNGFFLAHEALYENQRALSRADLERLGERLGLDGRQTRRALDNHTHRDTIQRDIDLAARVGASGTPNFFINGVQVRGAQPYEEFARVVDQQRIVATLLVANGTPRSRVYDTVMEGAVR